MNTSDAWDAAREAGEPNAVQQIGSGVLDQILGKANARMVFGDPVQHGNKTVIPVARISTRFGFGGGSGKMKGSIGPDSGLGGGGGGSVDAKPIGFIEITDDGAEFHEISDSTQIAMAGIRIGMVLVVLVTLRLLFLRRRRRDDARAIVATRASRRMFRRRSPSEAVLEPEPMPETASRWFRRSAA